MKARSIVRQTGVIVLVAQVVCALALSAAALFNEHGVRLHALDVQLQGRSDSLLGAIQDAEDAADNVYIDPAELKLPQSDFYAVFNRGGSLLGSTARAPNELLARDTDGFRTVTVSGSKYRVYQRNALRIIDRAETSGVGLRRPVTIVYVSSEAHIWHEVLEAASFYLITILLAAAITIGIVTFLVRRTLQPLADLADRASHVRMHSLTFQAPSSAQQVRELQPLSQALTELVSGLRSALEMEQRFFGDAAHELKTAVAVARSSVQVLMLKERSPAEYRAGLNRILDDNNRLEALTMEMLNLSSIGGTPVICEDPIDLREVVIHVCGQLGPMAEERKIRLRTEFGAPTAVPLSAERGNVLVSNLVVNALQHAPTHSDVTIRVHKTDAAQELVVSDKGRGIGSEALPHIFDRFFREDVSRSRSTGGSGLGLSICKSIVDAAGGSIAASSVRGLGTTVTVTFPG